MLAFGALTVSCGMTSGMKFLRMTVDHRDEVVLETVFDVPDTSPVSEMWEAAGRPPFATVSTRVNELEHGGDPLLVHLVGAVKIRITWTNSLETAAELTGLTLQRSSIDAEDWHLPTAEVRRAKEAAGL